MIIGIIIVKVIRNKYDTTGVVGRKTSRSRYGTKKSGIQSASESAPAETTA